MNLIKTIFSATIGKKQKTTDKFLPLKVRQQEEKEKHFKVLIMSSFFVKIIE